jgi:toxin ParE1/3/4
VRQCEITRRATQDLNAISDYFVDRNIEAGERLLREFNQKCIKLAQFPHLGKRYAYVRPWLRGLPLEGYIIFYEVTDDTLTILRVVSGRQDLTALFDDAEQN